MFEIKSNHIEVFRLRTHVGDLSIGSSVNQHKNCHTTVLTKYDSKLNCKLNLNNNYVLLDTKYFHLSIFLLDISSRIIMTK